MRTKYGLTRQETLDAIEKIKLIMQVELSDALQTQHSCHDKVEADKTAIQGIFETSRIVSNCLVIELFLDHIRKEIF